MEVTKRLRYSKIRRRGYRVFFRSKRSNFFFFEEKYLVIPITLPSDTVKPGTSESGSQIKGKGYIPKQVPKTK